MIDLIGVGGWVRLVVLGWGRGCNARIREF